MFKNFYSKKPTVEENERYKYDQKQVRLVRSKTNSATDRMCQNPGQWFRGFSGRNPGESCRFWRKMVTRWKHPVEKFLTKNHDYLYQIGFQDYKLMTISNKYIRNSLLLNLQHCSLRSAVSFISREKTKPCFRCTPSFASMTLMKTIVPTRWI